MLANFVPNVVQRCRVLHHGVSRDYRAKVGDLPEQEIQVGVLLVVWLREQMSLHR